MSHIQPWQRVIDPGTALAYMKARGRPRIPYIPEVPVFVKTSRLTSLRAQQDGVLPPVVDPGDVVDRDTLLKPWYGKLGQVGSPYASSGPTKEQVGPRYAYSELTEFNSAATQSLSITAPVVWNKQIIHGRLLISGAGQITATDCVFDGPANPTGTWISGETAILDFTNAGTSTMSTFKDCAVYARIPNPRLNAFKGPRHKIERCHMFWTTDGVAPYSNGTTPTGFEMVASRVEQLVYWPGQYYANRNPLYWDGAAYSAAGAGSIVRSVADGLVAGAYDNLHNDGNHTDAVQIHNSFGSHTYSPGMDTWSGDGTHIWGCALLCTDAYGQANPSNLPIPLPVRGRGDGPLRGLPGGGQKPGVNSYTTWEKPLIGTSPAQYAGNGVALYIGHVTGAAFENVTSVLVHDNYLNGGGMGMQEQRKGQAFIQFNFYDNKFGPDWYAWATTNDRDMYPVRLNDYATANAMPDFVAGPVRIPNHPATGQPPFGTGASNVWYDPGNKFAGRNGQPLGLGSSTVPGIRVI